MKKLFEYIKSLYRDMELRRSAFSVFAALLGVLYIVFNLILGILYSEAWNVAVSAYYLVLLISRYVSLDDTESSSLGALMLILSVPMCGIVIRIALTGRAPAYPSWVFYPLAIYFVFTLFRVVVGTRAMFSEHESFSAHAVSLSALLFSAFNFQSALVSLLSLPKSVSVRLNLVGALVVSVFMLVIGILSVRRTQKDRNQSF